MTPYLQTKLHGDTQRGDCQRTAFAALLDLPVEEVPAFEELESEWPVCWAWLASLGLEMETWWAGQDGPPPGYSIAFGPGPRECWHCCIALDGKIVHDVHPSGEGLLEIQGWWVVSKQG